ncbi:MAG: SPOR domain-containing protein [Saprospiraceae bacterium]|nr:SPOR domain-containing protein [Saprospiraceae bacterium]MBK8110106.1 SPOR domain-containing protein [Saprospiraceae bacterium]MBK8850636.1 SPOR domain-containing protein [Saprospiraceae bacterium]MBL0081062.1 SPOR domain-containing protein [Saprospiraceae bacterium]
MSRVLKIMSVAVVLFLAYMWISVLTKSCNKEKEEQVKVEQQTDKGDEFSEEEFFAEEGDTTVTAEPVDYKEIDETIEKTVDKTQQNNGDGAVEKETPPVEQNGNKKQVNQQAPAPVAKPAIKPKAPATKQPPADEVKKPEKLSVPIKKAPEAITKPSNNNASSSAGNFIVVAGNYLVEDNANTMLQKLKKNGFSNAEKVVFDLSEFFTVVAGRYSSQEAAAKTINNLKSKGIDAYLHRKK